MALFVGRSASRGPTPARSVPATAGTRGSLTDTTAAATLPSETRRAAVVTEVAVTESRTATMPRLVQGPPQDEPAAMAIVAAFQAKAENRLDDFYVLLHPSQRALVPIDTFKRCFKSAPADRKTTMVPYSAQDSALQFATIPEHASRIVGLRFSNGATSTERRFYVVYSGVEGDWRWVLGDDQVKELAAGRCPQAGGQ